MTLVGSGRPIGQPVVMGGPFVMNTRSEIDQAVRNYRAGKFGAATIPRVRPVSRTDSVEVDSKPQDERLTPFSRVRTGHSLGSGVATCPQRFEHRRS